MTTTMSADGRYQTETTVSTYAVMYRCRNKHALRRDYERTRVRSIRFTASTPGGLLVSDTSRSTENARVPVRCPQCDGLMTSAVVRGSYSQTRKCDPRCTSATGFNCECQCSGQNHGAAHLG